MVDLPASANNSFNFDLIKLFSAFNKEFSVSKFSILVSWD